MSLSTTGRTWEEASSPAAVLLARRFESACRDSNGRRPDPTEFLPDDPREHAGARLALLRADLTLRWESGERIGAEWYRDRYPDLDDEAFVALIYEEYCLREDASDEPDPTEYLARFPSVASRLRRVFDIHGLVGSGQTTTSRLADIPAVLFPEAGQTIAGFHLVEELGRGAFARVFLAKERQLADRPVALKVGKTGTREPQTLARLQHTHIVPVHSYRVDQATDLHLLCMPYFGRLTLAHLLADPGFRTARSGADIVELLDRLGPNEGPPSGRSAGRSALTQRTFAQAIAWWGARMAEALDHAHERGVLHRDVKPSNVLVTGDGMPMLLDFNLAREVIADAADATSALGGTLDYMAPEHLEELADGVPGRVDARSDVFSLGVLLYETLAGSRPFATPHGALSAGEILHRAAETRRAGAVPLAEAHPEIPSAFDAIVRRCLEPNPNDRYASAADLAADLHAIADDRPLRFAREPLPSRAVRWLRRNRRVLAMATPIILAVSLASAILIQSRIELRQVTAEVLQQISEGEKLHEAGDFRAAKAHFETAADQSNKWERLTELHKRARKLYRLADETDQVRSHADRLFAAGEHLRFRLIGFGGDLPSATRDLLRVLKPFYVLDHKNWTERSDLTLLDAPRKTRLLTEVNELLFLWIVALDVSGDRDLAHKALPICERALVFAEPKRPWRALRDRLAAKLGVAPLVSPSETVSVASEPSALGCFQWGVLRGTEHRHTSAIAWLKRAVELKDNDYWHQYYLAFFLHNDCAQDPSIPQPARAEAMEQALGFYNTAVALRSDSPWVRLSRARLYQSQGAWSQALNEFERALSAHRALLEEWAAPQFETQIRLEQGLVHQSLGAYSLAREDYSAVIAADPTGDYGRAARLNRAKLEVDESADGAMKASAEYDALLEERPDDTTARLGRALLALRRGDGSRAENDLTDVLTRDKTRRAEALEYRAEARLALGRRAEAEADVSEALRIEATPGRSRLRTRIMLAEGKLDGLRLDRPDELARLPMGGPALIADLRAAADRLAPETTGAGAAAVRALGRRAVILSALGDSSAEAEATRAVELDPLSPRALLGRARIRRRRGNLQGARADVERGIALDPEWADLWELRGLIKTELGDPRAGLDDLEQAQRWGAGVSLYAARASTLAALGNREDAVREWTRALSFDHEDTAAFLGRARAYLQLQKWDQALADLEQAAALAGDDPALCFRTAVAYAQCLPHRTAQLARAVTLARRAWTLARKTGFSFVLR